MKNKIIAIITVMSVLIGIFPGVFANETEYINPYQPAELYCVEVQNGKTVLSGRWFGSTEKDITVALTDADGNKLSGSGTPYSSDGLFMISVNSTEFEDYDIEISGEEGIANFSLDFTGISSIFSTNGSFVIDSFMMKHNRFIMKGSHNAKEVKSVTMKAMYKDNEAESEGIAALKQAISDDNGNFEIEFDMTPAEIQLQLMGKGLDMATYNCELPMRDDIILCEEDYEVFNSKLTEMVSILDELAEECTQRNISTDYEDVNREIIRKFISNIKTEIEKDATARLGQYNYALTKLYLEAYENMKAYIDGTKKPFSVPEYVTGDIAIDGTNITGLVEEGGETRNSSLFFTGFSGWDSIAEEIPYLSKVGFNTIQTELKMYDVLVRDNVDFWGVRTLNEPEIMFNTVTDTAKTGSSSLHIDAMESTPANSYKYIIQKIKVKPNTTYEYGLCGKGTINVEKAIHINLNGLSGIGRKWFTSSDDWKNYDYTYKTSSDQTEITVCILAEAYGETENIADYYIDDVYVKEQGTDVNLVENGGFEDRRTETALDEEAEAFGLKINYERLEWLREVLTSAQECGVMVDLGVGGGYYMPYYIRSIEGVEDGGRGFTNYSLTNETVRDILSLWARLLVSVIEDYESVKTLCLLNEPEVHANLSDHYDDDWTEFLINRYESINELNEVYNTEYTSFSQVLMPKDYKEDGTIGSDIYKIYRTPVYHDYMDFNDGLLANFVEWFADEVRNVNQDLLLHVKYMEYFRNDYRRYHNQGTNWEMLSEHLDINGCDAHSYYEFREKTPMSLKMANYDFMTSVKDAPVMDSESHIIDDPPTVLESGEKTPVYSDKITRYIGAEIWNGAIHGGNIRQYWIWDMHHMSMPWGSRKNQNSNFALRPEELAVMSKTSKDLMRLSDEVYALQNAERNAAILYSRINASYSESSVLNPYMQSIQAAYEELISTGQRVGFVTDSSPADVHKYKLVVITNTTNISADMLNELKAYIENGGKVVLQNSTLANNEYDKAHNEDVLSYVKSNAVADGDISDTVASLGIDDIKIVDAETGEYPAGVEWLYVKKNNKYLINIMNYGEDNAAELKLYRNGIEITSAKELRSGNTLSTLTANPMSPILISVGDGSFDLVDDNGEVLKSNITELESGNIRCNLPAEGTKILAIYKDDVLVKVSLNQNVISFTPTDNGKYRLMSADWNMQTYKPIREEKTIEMEVIE